MATAELLTIGSIATFIVETIQVPTGISGNMVEIVDQSRQFVANYTGDSIGSNAIGAKYQPAIIDFAKADTIDLIGAQAGGEKIKLGDLSIAETGEEMSAKQYKLMGDMKLKAIGRKIQFARSIS